MDFGYLTYPAALPQVWRASPASDSAQIPRCWDTKTFPPTVLAGDTDQREHRHSQRNDRGCGLHWQRASGAFIPDSLYVSNRFAITTAYDDATATDAAALHPAGTPAAAVDTDAHEPSSIRACCDRASATRTITGRFGWNPF